MNWVIYLAGLFTGFNVGWLLWKTVHVCDAEALRSSGDTER